MRYVQTNGELEALHRDGTGLILNYCTSGPTAADKNRLHLASCRWVETMVNQADPAGALSAQKIFFSTLDEAIDWAEGQHVHADAGWQQCPWCNPGRLAFGGMADDDPPEQVRRIGADEFRGEVRSLTGATDSELATGRPMTPTWWRRLTRRLQILRHRVTTLGSSIQAHGRQ